MQHQPHTPPHLRLSPSVLRTLQEVRRGALQPGQRVAMSEIWERGTISPQLALKDLTRLQEAGVVVDANLQGATVAPDAAGRALEFERTLFLATEWPAIRARLEELGLVAPSLTS